MPGFSFSGLGLSGFQGLGYHKGSGFRGLEVVPFGVSNPKPYRGPLGRLAPDYENPCEVLKVGQFWGPGLRGLGLR